MVEAYVGVDPLGVDIINGVIGEKKEQGVAVIVSTHLQNLLVDVSDSINIMSKGELLGIMPADSLTGPEGMTTYSQMLIEHKNKVGAK